MSVGKPHPKSQNQVRSFWKLEIWILHFLNNFLDFRGFAQEPDSYTQVV